MDLGTLALSAALQQNRIDALHSTHLQQERQQSKTQALQLQSDNERNRAEQFSREEYEALVREEETMIQLAISEEARYLAAADEQRNQVWGNVMRDNQPDSLRHSPSQNRLGMLIDTLV